MALENPITSDDLTINFATLLDLSVRDRVQAAAADTGFAQALMASLTPIQMAKAFPDYYRKELPDISNFILANRYLDSGGRFDQRGGGDYGDDKPFYEGETAIPAGQNPIGVPEPSIEEMQAKLLEKGIDVNKTYDAIANGLSADDPQVQFLKNISADKLAAMGIEQFKSDDGTLMYRKAPELSDQEVSNKISGKFVAKENASEKQKAVIEFASRWNISPQAAAGVLNIESGVTSDITGGGISKKTGQPDFHGVFQLQTEQIRGLTEKAGFGSLTPAQYKKLSVSDQLKVMDEYYKQHGITPEFFTGDPQTDASKMWALQLAPSNAKSIDYNNPNAVISKTDQASTIEARNNLVTVGSAGSGSIAGGEQFLGDSFTRIEGTASPEQIAEFRNQQRKQQKEAFIRGEFHQASPTSLDAMPDPQGRTVVENQSQIAGVRRQPITPELKEVLQYAGEESGVVVEVFSGGQNDITQGGARTGSERHDLGHAADVKLKVAGPDGKMRVLDARNPEDQVIMSNFVEKARMMGAKGIGSGLGYMGESGIHIGTVTRSDIDYSNKEYGAPAGSEAVWRSDKWAQDAFVRGQQAAVDFEKAGGMPEFRKRRDEKIAEQQKKESDKTVAAKQQETVQVNVNEIIPHDHAGETAEEHHDHVETQTTKVISTPVGPVGGPEEAPKFGTDTSRKVIEPTETVTPAPAVPVATAEQAKPTETASATPVAPVGGPEEVRKFRTGGSPDVQDDENLSVFDEDGSLKWKMNSGEGIYVKPKDNEYADDKMDELSGRIDELDDKMGSPAPEKNKPKTAPDKAGARPDKNWQQDASTVTYSIGSQNRAFKRTKFQNEGFHFNRSAPNSISS